GGSSIVICSRRAYNDQVSSRVNCHGNPERVALLWGWCCESLLPYPHAIFVSKDVSRASLLIFCRRTSDKPVAAYSHGPALYSNQLLFFDKYCERSAVFGKQQDKQGKGKHPVR